MSENMPKPSAFSLIYRADDTAIFIDSIQNFRVADFCCPADLLHLSPYPHFKSFDPFHIISVLDIVHVSAAYKATLHTRHLAIHFLKSRFTLPLPANMRPYKNGSYKKETNRSRYNMPHTDTIGFCLTGPFFQNYHTLG